MYTPDDERDERRSGKGDHFKKDATDEADTEETERSGRRGGRKLVRKDKKGVGSDELVIEVIEKKDQPEYRINNGTD